MSVTGRKLWRTGLMGIAVGAAGCAPGGGGTARLASRPDAETPELAVQPAMPEPPQWRPETGRLVPSVQRRHFPARRLEPAFQEALTDVGENRVGAWRLLKGTTARPTRFRGVDGVHLAGTAELGPQSPGGIERELDASLFAGNDVRIELTFACPSARMAAAMASVRVEVAGEGDGRSAGVVGFPVIADRTPGWETQSSCIRVDATVRRLRLRILLDHADAAITLARVSASPASAVLRTAASRPVSRGGNVVPDGDFEAGQPRFFASAIDRWPNGDEMVLPVQWEFANEAARGTRSLAVSVDAPNARVGFGPIDLSEAIEHSSWYLGFSARSELPRPITVTLRSRDRVLSRAAFQVAAEWKRFTHALVIRVLGPVDRLDLAACELTFDLGASGPGDSRCWLDAVSLAPAGMQEQWPDVGALGLIGPRLDPADLNHLVDEKAGDGGFEVRLVRGADSAVEGPPGTTEAFGRLAIDVVDAWDRVVWTRTSAPVFASDGRFSERIRPELPRGHYRVLATLWSGEPGSSDRLADSQLALAVLSMRDPVPVRNAFGLSAVAGAISMHTTHLGAGWCRGELPAHRVQVSPPGWNFGRWARPLPYI